MIRRLAWIAAGLCLVIVVVVLWLPRLVDLEPVKARWLPQLSRALQRDVTAGTIRVSLWPPVGITVREVAISDAPEFSDELFASADAVTAQIALWPLLRRRVEVTRLTITSPRVALIKNRRGGWNYESVGRLSDRPAGRSSAAAGGAAPAGGVEPAGLLLLFSAIDLRNGRLTVTDRSADEPGFTGARQIELSVKDLAPGRQVAVKASALLLPGQTPVAISGTAELTQTGLAPSGAALQLSSGAQTIDVTVRPTTPSSWLVGIASDRLIVFGFTIDALAAEVLVEPGRVRVQRADGRLFGGTAQVRGTVDTSGAARPFQAKITTTAIDVGALDHHLTGQEPRMTGKADAKASVTGRWKEGSEWPELANSLEGVGELSIRDGAWQGVDIVNSVLSALHRAEGTAQSDADTPSTVFSSLTAAMTVGKARANISSLKVTDARYALQASGTIGLVEPMRLDLRSEMRLSPEISRRFTASSTASLLLTDQGQLALPVLIQGTLAKPRVLPDAKLLAKRTGQRLSERVLNEVLTDEVEQLQETGQSLLKELLKR